MRILSKTTLEANIETAVCEECNQVIWRAFRGSGNLVTTSPYANTLTHYYFEHQGLYFVLKNSEETLRWENYSGEYRKCSDAIEEINAIKRGEEY